MTTTQAQPAKPASDHHRTLSKWLNEEQTGPIDRVALAHVLGATASSADSKLHSVEPLNQRG